MWCSIANKRACFHNGNSVFQVGICQTFPQPTIRHKKATAYNLRVQNLPWHGDVKYQVTVQRVEGGEVHRTILNTHGRGHNFGKNSSLHQVIRIDIGNRGLLYFTVLEIPFPANAQDLVTIERV